MSKGIHISIGECVVDWWCGAVWCCPISHLPSHQDVKCERDLGSEVK